jgi:hypothetical protein
VLSAASAAAAVLRNFALKLVLVPMFVPVLKLALVAVLTVILLAVALKSALL